MMIIYFIICSIIETIEMGGHSLTCQRDTNKNAEIIVQQMEIYKWRQSNYDKYLPKVILASQSELKQQQVLREFLDKYRNQDSISLQKMNAKIQQIAQNHQQILNFEKYACNLQEIDTVLQIEELAYLFSALLTAYEEIKRRYKTIVVEKQCCFVTFQGEVRVWINSNPKSNQLQTNSNYQYFSQRDYRPIVGKIINICKQTAIKSAINQTLFCQLERYFTTSALRNDIFENLRIWMSEFCRKHGVSIAHNIKSALMRVKTLNILKLSKRKSLNKQSSSTKDGGICNISTNCFNSPRSNSIREEITRSQIQQRFVKPKIKASDTTFGSFSGMNQSGIVIPPIYFANQPVAPAKIRFSQVCQTARTYQEHQKKFKGSQVLNRTQKPKIKEEKKDPQVKKVQFKIDQNNEGNIFEINQSQGGALLEGNFLTSKQLTNNMTSRNRPIRHRRSNQQKKIVTRKVSILDLEKSQSEASELKQNRKPDAHCHTFQQINSIQTITDVNRPWITSKTITRLISDGFDEIDSLVHSVGTSSQYAGSQYGGALSNMGRQISSHKRSNTSYLAKAN